MDSLASYRTPALGCLIGLFMLFGGALAGFCYCVSFFFSSPQMSQIVVIFLTLILGLILNIAGIVLRSIQITSDYYNNGIRYAFALFPPFALGEGMHNLVLIDVYSFFELKGGQKYHQLDWEICGLPLTFLAIEFVVYISIAILYEYISTIPSYQKLVSANVELTSNDTVKDQDVLAEEARVKSGEADSNSTILAKDLKKVYPGGKYAVKGVSLGIPNGECFGLLGINGAGKSTTLAMLSGETLPSSGTAYLGGLDLFTDIYECRRKIGFCPQVLDGFHYYLLRSEILFFAV
jgi:ABC-type multidrug transport system fused ATPase/permease subunit